MNKLPKYYSINFMSENFDGRQTLRQEICPPVKAALDNQQSKKEIEQSQQSNLPMMPWRLFRTGCPEKAMKM